MKFGFFMLSFILTILFIVGCGGSGGNVTTASSTLNGTVATGTGQIADIVIIDSAGHSVTTASDQNGAFSITTAGLTQPIMIQTTIRSTGNLMYSFASTSRGTLNVTPLTTYIVDQSAVAAGITGGASQLFQNFAASSSSIASHISTETTTLNGVISSSMSDFNVSGFNHFGGSFRANHTGYDAFLDSLDIEMQQDDVIIRHNRTTLDTLNYDIQTQEINITGRIVNVSTNAPISGATIQAVDNRGHSISATTDSDGAFIITADTMRNYNVTITANGYITQYIPRVSSFMFTDQQIGTVFMFPNNLSGTTTTVSGSVIDARTESTGINGATLTFRSGYNTRVGPAIASTTTDSTGTYTIAALAIGSYTVEVVKSGFATRYLNLTVIGSTMSENFSLVSQVISGNSNGFATIVLNWGENPSDLDSHLTGPATTDRFHIYYLNKKYVNDNNITGTFDPENPCATSNIVANLDRDDVTSYGPETTTLCRPTAGGLYKYYIHHFAGASTIGASSATVTLTLSNGTTRTFTPPTGSTGWGDIWHVFNFDSDGNVYPINQIIGNGSSSSPLMSLSILDTKFRAESNLFLKLPTK